MVTGQTVTHPEISGLPVSDITATPRKYGLHATIKPPFRLAEGRNEAELSDACATLCARLDPVTLQGLQITAMGRFLALCPMGDVHALNELAATCVETLDPFRAPATPDDLARRRANRLSDRQESNLLRWGYPYVMDQFRFHITLTGRLSVDDRDVVQSALTDYIAARLPAPIVISELALVGEADDGFFHLIHRYPLAAARTFSRTESV